MTTPLDRVFQAVNEEARLRGCTTTASEIIGLVPKRAMEGTSPEALKLEGFSEDKILENRLERVAGIELL